MKLHRSKILALSEDMVLGEVDVDEWEEEWNKRGGETKRTAGRNPKVRGKKGEADDWFFNHYQDAATALINRLSDKDWDSYKLIAENWKKQGPPTDVQAQ
jgi:hypothetical protein